MKEIKSIHFQHLRNEAHYEFSWTVQQLLIAYTVVQELVVTLYGTFSKLLVLEKKLLDAMRASLITAEVETADHRVDRALSAMNSMIAAAKLSADERTAEAGRRLYTRFKAFGSIRRKAYEEEVAAVQVLVDELDGVYQYDAILAKMEDLVKELKAAVKALSNALMSRGHEESTRPKERLVDVRREIEAVYRGMMTIIDASDIVAPTDDSQAFIAEVNEQVEYFNDHDHQHARKDIGVAARCVVEPVETRQYSGKAITPIPRAHYREEGKPTVELVFARDFFVTYKNNTDVGMADLILHGKGAYKGQKGTTFHIAR
jgi:hypothetical protein